MQKKIKQSLERRLYGYLTNNFCPDFGRDKSSWRDNELWQKISDIGSELWLDSGDISEISKYWTRQFTAVTTNNSLLNKVIQTGVYDSVIAEVSEILNDYELDDQQRKLEFAFVLNAYHALRLVERFDAFVSVEQHTDLAFDVNLALEYARRYYAVCPERFIIKIPFTAAGLLASLKAYDEGIPINHTLGFSARQNYIATRIAKPKYVNVFLGRLNSFISENNLGDGLYVGEKAALASNAVVNELRQTYSIPTRQIAASIRDGRQILNLAGVNIITMPPNAAGEFINLKIQPEMITDHASRVYQPGITDKSLIEKYRINTLWQLTDQLINCADKLEIEDVQELGPDDLINFFNEHDCGDVLVRWSEKEFHTSMAEGKIPYIENWKQILLDKTVGVDSLMNLAGLCSFMKDQQAMDAKIKSVLLTV